MQRWRVLVVVVTLAALAAATVLGLVVRTPTTTLTEPVRWAETQNFWQAALAFLPVGCLYQEQSYLPRLTASPDTPGNSSPEAAESDRRSKDERERLHL